MLFSIGVLNNILNTILENKALTSQGDEIQFFFQRKSINSYLFIVDFAAQSCPKLPSNDPLVGHKNIPLRLNSWEIILSKMYMDSHQGELTIYPYPQDAYRPSKNKNGLVYCLRFPNSSLINTIN